MYGDHSGSPRRDSRQDGAPPPPTEDVKVAGTPISAPTDYLGQTAALPPAGDPYQPMGQYQEAPLQEGSYYDGPPPAEDFDATGRPARNTQKIIKIAAVAAAVAVIGGGSAGAWAMTSSGGSSGKEKGDQQAQAQAQAQAPAPLTDAQRKVAEAQRTKELKERASRAAREDADTPKFVAKGKPVPKKKDPGAGTAGDPVPAGTAQQIARSLLPSFGWSPSSQFGCLVRLWDRESGWNVHASNPSGAYGIPQAKPGSKMSSAGPDWQNNARTQIKWGLGYIKDRYSSPCGAWSHSQSTGWY